MTRRTTIKAPLRLPPIHFSFCHPQTWRIFTVPISTVSAPSTCFLQALPPAQNFWFKNFWTFFFFALLLYISFVFTSVYFFHYFISFLVWRKQTRVWITTFFFLCLKIYSVLFFCNVFCCCSSTIVSISPPPPWSHPSLYQFPTICLRHLPLQSDEPRPILL